MSKRGGNSKVVWIVILSILALGVIISGVVCGTLWYKETRKTSYINGSINVNEIANRYREDYFSYSSDKVYLAQVEGTDTYQYKETIKTALPFNGAEKEYQLLFNDFVIYHVDYQAGSVQADVVIDFYDNTFSVANEATLTIAIRYLSNRTELTLSTTGAASAGFLNQYFEDFNCRISVPEIVEDL